MNIYKIYIRISALIFLLVLFLNPTNGFANQPRTASSYGGTYTSWPTAWVAVNALNDPDDGLTNARIDFVGDAIDPGFFIAGNSDYCYFRIRVDDGAAINFSDTHMILIDKDQNGTFDYAFSWDSQSNMQSRHGLEMQIPGSIGATWATTNADDIDGAKSAKHAPPDFGLSNGDGYIRILNGQNTTNFGTTTFIDIAVKWGYLTANTSLAKGQTWNIQLGSINQSNDHNWIDGDVAGNRTPDQAITFPGTISFSSPTAIGLSDINDKKFSLLPLFIISILIFCIFAGYAFRKKKINRYK